MRESIDFNNFIQSIFRVNKNDSEHLITRESTTVEFKRNFNKGSAWNTYGKSIAAFANTRGGCLVFGVGDQPRHLLGMSNSRFENLDPEEFTCFLNEKFSPEIHWYMYIHEIRGKKFGLLYVLECNHKPVIAKTNGGDKIYEADIYYRYRGRSEKIKYPELRHIFETQRKQEQELWLRHLQRIASVGIENAAIFNTEDGLVAGRSGAFIIDRQLLPSLQFIREGEFREVIGAPAIRLVGEAQILAVGDVRGSEVVVERQAIHAAEIVEFFLLQRRPRDPHLFIEQACHEPTGYLPIYYFAQMACLDREALTNLVREQRSSALGKRGLLQRLNSNDESLNNELLDSGSTAAKEKRECRQLILDKKITQPTNDSALHRRLDATRSLKREEIDIDYVFPLLLNWYKQYWDRGGNVRSNLYKAICHLDKLFYGYVPDST